MKICIYGAGAIGGYLAVPLALAGEEVTVIARGAHLEAIRENGLRLIADGETRTARVRATDDPAEAGPQDYVMVAVKAPAVRQIAEKMAPLFGPGTAVVTAMNGIPWWYFYKLPGPWENHRLKSVDPDGRIWELIPPERAIGCIVYPACEVVGPGVIRHVSGNRFELGEPDGTRSERCKALSQAMIRAGFRAPVRTRIRDDIWVKLWGNATFNPVSALTHGTLEQLATDPGTRAVIRAAMEEIAGIMAKLEVKLPVDIDTRIQWAAHVGAHKTSMLQDLERGRSMELDALVTVVVEIGELVGVPTPRLNDILALARQRARVAGCYPG